MSVPKWVAGLAGLAGIVCVFSLASAQEVRRAQPVEEPLMGRPVPFDAATPSPAPRRDVAPTQQTEPQPADPAVPPSDATESAPAESESPAQRQLNYANALFGRKLYDLAAPEYEKFLGAFSSAPGRASAYFYLGGCYRALGRGPAARSSFQSVLDEYGESEFAGPAAYGVAEILFTQKDYKGAFPLFHRAAAKTTESALPGESRSEK
jgi:TolA-binding protein